MIANKQYRMPAEWEPQSGVQLTWPHAQTDWAPMLDEITVTYRQMAQEIEKREPLLVVGPPSNDTWARDHGFITLVSDSQPDPLLLDFKFNGWGEKFPADLDNEINRRMMEQGILEGQYEDHLDFVLEGGSIESDGKGTILTTSKCLLAPHRNQPLTKEQIEARLLKMLHAERILWLDYGYLAGDDTDSHIDTLARFCPDDTIAYVQCLDENDEHFAELQQMETQLKAFRTIDGEPYRLIPLPMAKAVYDEDGTRLPATYANFLITNGAVLMPTYGDLDTDKKAEEQLRKAFPNHDIIGIDCCPLITQHGSLHCCTMQYPKEAL